MYQMLQSIWGGASPRIDAQVRQYLVADKVVEDKDEYEWWQVAYQLHITATDQSEKETIGYSEHSHDAADANSQHSGPGT